MENKIFGFAEEQLAEMLEPMDTFEHKVNEITTEECDLVHMVFDRYSKVRYLTWVQDTIMQSRMSKKDKEALTNDIGAIIGEFFNAGRMDALKDFGDFDEVVKETAEQRVKKWAEEEG